MAGSQSNGAVLNGRLHQYLLYLIFIIMAMLGYFFKDIKTEIDRVARIQNERTTRVEGIKELGDKVERLAIQLGTITGTETTLKRHEEMIRRIEDRVERLEQVRQGREMPS